tara:strand:- start:46 stop:177 length:132 start_codon:yes stop_codon:yes gene_type:complete
MPLFFGKSALFDFFYLTLPVFFDFDTSIATIRLGASDYFNNVS